MGNKLIVPVTMIVLVIGAGVAIYFLLNSGSPRSKPAIAGNSAPDEKPPAETSPLEATEFEVTRLKPDPVTSERPNQPFVAPKAGVRIVISGRVADETGAGVADARVQFNGYQKLRDVRGTGYTDASGIYRLLAWAAREDNVTGEAFGRVSAEAPDGRVVVGNQVAVADGTEMPELQFGASAVLEGQVTNRQGERAPGTLVTVRSGGPVQVNTLRTREPSASRRQYVTSTIADANGRYRFVNLPPGRYSLAAEGGYFGVNPAPIEVDLTSTTYQWQEMQLDPGKSIRGVVTDQAGNAIPGVVVKISAKPADGDPTKLKAAENLDSVQDRMTDFRTSARTNVNMGRDRVVTDAAGRFGFTGITNDAYKLEAKLGAGEAQLTEVRASQSDYTLQLRVETSIGGVVRDAQTRLPIESFDARALIGDGGGDASPFDRVADDGMFTYHPGGGYMLMNPVMSGGVVRISAAGYMPATVSIGELREGDARRDLDVTLKPLCNLTFEISRDGRRLDLEPVALVFEDLLAFEASSDELGRVRIPRVAPATYRVKVFLADGTKLEADIVVPAAREAELQVKLDIAK